METCKTCRYFKRTYCNELLYKDCNHQLGGNCTMIKQILETENPWMWDHDCIYVRDTFGCKLWKPCERGGL